MFKKQYVPRFLGILVPATLFSIFSCTDSVTNAESDNWPTYGGNYAGNRYSSLSNINLDNVSGLEVAWEYNAADPIEEGEWPRQIQCQPVMVDGILYGTTPKLKLFALDAATGEELWKFDPQAVTHGYNSSSRGIMYWEDGEDRRVLYAAGTYLMAVDANTGKLVESFADAGRLDLHTGLENDRYDINDLVVTATSPGVIHDDVLVMGSTVSESGDALPGDIRGFDVRTGKLLWVFHTVPRPGEFGYDTWPKDAYKKIGGVNNWAGMSLDEERGVVYLGTGSPSVDFYGGDREGANLYANCILAIEAKTGKLKWYYQVVHHDLWDLDLASPPNLTTIEHEGKQIDVVVQVSKDGVVYVLDRDTGESIFPVEEREVRTDGLPGEHPYPTQKFPLKPDPLVTRQVITEADLPDSILFPEAHVKAKERFLSTRGGEKYLPPSIKGSWYIGVSGGAEWGGSAVNPEGIFFQNVNEMPWEIKMVNVAEQLKETTSLGNRLFVTNCALCHGVDRKGDGADFPSLVNIGERLTKQELANTIQNGRGRMPAYPNLSYGERNAIISYLTNVEEAQPKDEHTDEGDVSKKSKDFPYVPEYNRGRGGKVNIDGYPGIKPPWGTLNAIDLNTGEYVWRVPLGEHPELTEKGIPITGTENTGGPLATAGGLVFIGATQDERFRAFDTKTGKIVWEYQLPAGAFATPITYSVNGKQYVVVAAGGVRFGKKPGGSYIAFALPNE
ncbi:PQQ-binding-like beta-propeller repeat protein [Flagellimonas pelagia]|uniref:PQQ-binding-like beta-propeller repeat protein n=1 Tax=Flagellimonas pelagia TaxID=2306998 RepID=A0A3A1NDZ4_9FLAO|nr:PQQ-binding-like beta-propeller repeat protein [Allomuricauda maritima]RIV42262.1 pyrroloquinoline quinone-dependent dehydrogenase [Allomuricauda maritima]TXJ91151.1 PQQ-binding-like beta-propeller repeat protein [Allomuricauda maritima]